MGRRWAWLSFLAASWALAGCMEAVGPPGAGAERPDAAAEGQPSTDPAAPSALPTVSSDGLAWSGCALRSNGLAYQHEWADGLVPPEYGQAATAPGEVGEGLFHHLACAGVAIGNQTHVAGASLAFFAVKVRPPPGLAGLANDFYLLDVLSDSPLLVDALAAAGMPASRATLAQDTAAYAVDGPRAAAQVEEVVSQEGGSMGTAMLRLHWQVEGRSCWADAERTVGQSAATQVVFRGLAGNPRLVTGPLHESAGAGQAGTESGSFSPPVCTAA